MSKYKVLVVDDSPTVRAQVLEALREQFVCIEAVDGQDGLSKANLELPDAVLTDLEMPNLDGIGLLRALKGDQRTQRIPVVVATTVNSVDRVNECRALGCAGFVLKPLDRTYLIAKLNSLLRRR